MTARAKANESQPIYMRVADELERKVASRSAGSLLPSENELALAHGVSRLTARAALVELERRYLVRRSQGKRAFVARRIEYIIGSEMVPSWTCTVHAAGATPRSETVATGVQRAPLWVCASLRLPPGSEALYLARERFVDDELAAYAQTWLAADVVPDLAVRLGPTGSLYDAFTRIYALEPVRAATRAEFVVATAAIARKLRMDGRPMLFRLEGRTDSQRFDRPLEVTTSWLRADMFRIVFAQDRACL